MKIMASYSSATAHKPAPHLTKISNAIKLRAQCVINNESIDAETRALVRYGLETNDPSLPELVRQIDAGETISDDLFVSKPELFGDSIEEKIEAMSDLICRAGDEPETKSAALLILMSTIASSTQPKALANTVKHFAFARCGALNLCGMVETQVAVLENELSSGHELVS